MQRGHMRRTVACDPHTPSPSSSSAASASSSSNGSSSSSSGSATASRVPSSSSSSSSSLRAGAAVSPLLATTADDSDLWASIRLASSPPAAPFGRPNAHAVSARKPVGTAASPAATAAMLPLVIDDFSQHRISHVPTVASRPSKPPPPPSSWSLRRPTQPPIAPTAPPPPSSAASALQRAHSLHSGAVAADVDAMDARVFVARDQWVPHRDRRACVVCDRDFGLLVRKKHSCRMCGDVVCSRCSLSKRVAVPGVGESKARVCSRCVLQYRHRQRVCHKPLSADDTLSRQPPHETSGHDDATADDDEPLASEYDSADELPSVEDVLRRTAAKVSGARLPVAPVVFFAETGHRRHRAQHKPVSLLSPELLASVSRESSSTRCVHSASLVLLSPTTSGELLELRLVDGESFSSTVSTVSSSLSSASSTRSATEEELAAALKARELEKEVETSRARIQELERRMQEQENKKTELSLEQQRQLREARELIAQLQQQLTQQEQHARDAAITRDSICRSNNMRQQQQQQQQPCVEPAPPRLRSDSVEAESEALRQKLRLLERQLQQAGINVAEVIPYAVAKQRIVEISRRMAEISDAEAALKLQASPSPNKAALRREYYVLEQDMERFHTALLMSDEYIEEQAARARAWEAQHAAANAAALRVVRSALPVDISRLSEQALRAMVTPSGRAMSADLARRFKRTNVLQLLRVAPPTVARMHPSVVESYRTAGLALLERRALHEALRAPAAEWRKQARDESAQRKAAWFAKLQDALVQALAAYEQHVRGHHSDEHELCAECPFLGRMCVVRAEQNVAQLYGAGLGFPDGDEFAEQEIVKSDPEGAGEKALLEARAQGGAAAASHAASARQSELKRHYGLRNVRLVTTALAAMEEVDAALARVRSLDDEAAAAWRAAREAAEEEEEEAETRWWRACESLVADVRELAALMARRAGICLSGKRDRAKDALDARSAVEAAQSRDALRLLDALVEDVARAVSGGGSRARRVPASCAQLKSALPRIRELVFDVQDKNETMLHPREPLLRSLAPVPEVDAENETDDASAAASSFVRVPWKDRAMANNSGSGSSSSATVTKQPTPSPPSPPASGSTVVSAAKHTTGVVTTRPPVQTQRSSLLLDAIRSKRTAHADAANESSATREAPPSVEAVAAAPPPPAEVATRTAPPLKRAASEDDAAAKPVDLLAAIRARKAKQTAAAVASA